MPSALIIMLKNPVRGKVKTRLAATVGEDNALKIYNALLHHTQKITEAIDADVFLFYSDLIEHSDMFAGRHYKKYVQCSGDLGVRMDYAFSIPFKNEYKNVIMVGADCFELTPEIIRQAFEQLNNNDFVIGPATDGGYYLIGMKKWNRWVLENKRWSTEHLFTDTRRDIEARNGSMTLLPALTDIDTIEDVNKFPELKSIIEK